MSIEDLRQKIKGFRKRTQESSFLRRFSRFRLPKFSEDIFLMLVIILVAFGAFGLGRLSKIEGSKTPIRIENAPKITTDTFSEEATKGGEKTLVIPAIKNAENTEHLVGSKTGSKYHYPWCGGASRIADGNRIYFASKIEAEKAGYTPAANCKGL